MKEARFIEIEPGEIRRVCLVCNTPVKEVHRLYCPAHNNGRIYTCKVCGKPATTEVMCQECREGKGRGAPVPVSHRPKMIAGKRIMSLSDQSLVEKWWAEGVTGKEIGKKLGLATKTPDAALSYKRKHHGWNLPYRHPHAIETGRKLAASMQEKARKRKATAV